MQHIQARDVAKVIIFDGWCMTFGITETIHSDGCTQNHKFTN